MEEVTQQEVTEQVKPKKKPNGAQSFLIGLLSGILVVGLMSALFIHFKYGKMSFKGLGTPKSEHYDTALTEESLQKLDTLENFIDDYYLNVDELSGEELSDALYHGLVDGLGDPYSTYYSKEELDKVMESNEGVYYGIGAYISIDSDSGYCKITKVMDESPAMEAGLEDDDIIIEVDGKDMLGVTTSDLVTYIKGPEHTTVDITVYRKGETEYLTYTVERRKIETPTVVYTMDDDKIATIQITEFDEVTLDQFETAFNNAKKDGMKGMILDLRDNPGGYLQTAVSIANYILPKGVVVYTEDRVGNRKDYNCDGKNELDVPLVVLVNGNSASASEIMAGAIKDYGKGTLLGTQTFGKGIVQKIFPLSDGSAIKLTISHYYTPNGNDIHGVGIEPDEVLEFDSDAYKKDKSDNQLDRAKEILRGEIK